MDKHRAGEPGSLTPGTGLLQSLTTDKLVGRHGPESLNGVPFARPSVEENGVEVESSCQ